MDPNRTTFQMAAGIQLGQTDRVRNNSQKPAQKTGNSVSDANRQLQELRRWENS